MNNQAPGIQHLIHFAADVRGTANELIADEHIIHKPTKRRYYWLRRAVRLTRIRKTISKRDANITELSCTPASKFSRASRSSTIRPKESHGIEYVWEREKESYIEWQYFTAEVIIRQSSCTNKKRCLLDGAMIILPGIIWRPNKKFSQSSKVSMMGKTFTVWLQAVDSMRRNRNMVRMCRLNGLGCLFGVEITIYRSVCHGSRTVLAACRLHMEKRVRWKDRGGTAKIWAVKP